ncbi:hypothetical protein MIND_00993900 [Mycena indigotica]|uniref:Uncharacterized protein n=1 Tax=Mycena indigotica TaxID=2126181 RepID=A0A8H6S818_9AGAR|nr:uncharacterized protein MIND_00993900 [Mycena indigotica]KAF7294574.1 hypothetical protein MIND_00993900 [Mycena indigotica]
MSSSSPPSPFAFASDDSIELIDILRSAEDSRRRRRRRLDRYDPTKARPPVALFCGADISVELADQHRPWRPQVVPDEQNTAPPRKRQRRSTGCGTRIHTEAHPDERWTGLPEGVGCLSHLDDGYFTPDARRQLRLGKESCGCTRTGVGCTVCGNPVGAFFKPCERHTAFLSHFSSLSRAHYVFIHTAVSPPLPQPTTRRIRTPSDDIQFGYPPRRIQDLAELRRARRRVQSEAITEDPPRRSIPLSRFFTWTNRTSPPPLPSDPVLDEGPFEAWADDTIERATALAATPVPIIDLTSIDDPPAQNDTSTRPVTPEWWPNSVTSPGQQSVAHDWPPITRSFERSTAGLADAVTETEEVEQEKEESEPRGRTFFER